MRLKLITNENERDFDEFLPDVYMGRKICVTMPSP